MFLLLSAIFALSSAQRNSHSMPNNDQEFDLDTSQAENLQELVFSQDELFSGNEIEIADPRIDTYAGDSDDFEDLSKGRTKRSPRRFGKKLKTKVKAKVKAKLKEEKAKLKQKLKEKLKEELKERLKF